MACCCCNVNPCDVPCPLTSHPSLPSDVAIMAAMLLPVHVDDVTVVAAVDVTEELAGFDWTRFGMGATVLV